MLINFSVCSVQSWRRAETPKWSLAYFSQTKSSRHRNGEIKNERQRESRDLAVRRVVLPGCAIYILCNEDTIKEDLAPIGDYFEEERDCGNEPFGDFGLPCKYAIIAQPLM
jgi:hypothetical protein